MYVQKNDRECSLYRVNGELIMELYEVVMAGGSGTRFWPLSRMERPKQFINVSGKDILLNETIARMDGLIKRENVYVVTGRKNRKLVEEEILNGIPFSNILTEPTGRNTAPCILYAASVLKKEKGDGIMCVFAADHHIKNVEEYRRIIQKAAAQAEKEDCIMTIGITPTYPATGYGYIKSAGQTADEIYSVEQFVEKPDLERAEEYLATGKYSWNSGVFVFKVSVILDAFKKYLPDMCEQMNEIIDARGTVNEDKVLDKVYPELESISLDYGIMENSDNVQVIAGNYGWSDVGSLDELGTFHEEDDNNNVLIGEDIITVDSSNCIVKTAGKLIALVGVEDIIAVDTDDTVLICRKDKAQEVKKVVEILKKQGKTDYL